MPSLIDVWPAMLLLAIIVSMPWLARRVRSSGWKGLKPTEQPTRLVSALAVGSQQRVVTIEVQQGSHTRRLLLGITPQSVTLLDAWSTNDGPQPLPAPHDRP